MKTYNEMADEVFHRRDEYVVSQKARRKKTIGVSLTCALLALLIGVGVWQSGLLTPVVQTADDAIYPGIKDTYGPGEEEPTYNENGIFQPTDSDTVTMENGERLKVISSIDELAPSYSYATPENGKCFFSPSLRTALEKYNDNELFRVVVRVWKDRNFITGMENLEPIADKFYEMGYTSAIEVVNDRFDHAVLTMLLKEEELNRFKADDEHGYFFFLYEENDGLGDWWQTAPKEQVYFVGKVIEIYEGGCMLEVTDNGNNYLVPSDRVIVNTDVDGCPDYVNGDFLRIEFDGTFAESYPLQILNVSAVEKTDSAGKVIE